MRQNTITREKIIGAALRVIRDQGLAGATTRAIVKVVPCAEGTLYLYFKHRTELILAVIEQSAQDFVKHLAELSRATGQNSVEENLATILRHATTFQQEALTLFCGVVSDPALLQAQQDVMRKARKGPHLSRLAIAQYLESEKKQARVDHSIDANMTSALLMRATFGRVFEERFSGRSSPSDATRHTSALIAALLHRAQPGRPVPARKRGSKRIPETRHALKAGQDSP